MLKVMLYIDTLQVVDNSEAYFRLQFAVVNGAQKIHCQRLEFWGS